LTKLHSTSGNAISRLGSLHESALKREYPRELSSPLSSHVPHRPRAGTCVNACFYCRASRPSKLRNGSRCRHSAKATPVHNEHRIDPKAPNVVRSCILLPLVCLNVCLTFQPSCTCCGCKLRCRMTTICSSKTIAGLRRFPGAKIPRSPMRFRFRLRTWLHLARSGFAITPRPGGVDPSTGCRRQQTLLSAPFGPLALQPQQGHHRDWQERSFDPLPE